MNEPKRPETATFLDLWLDKLFLGQEFLTWLWMKSEANGHYFDIKPLGKVNPFSIPHAFSGGGFV